jgi:pSer/pThr/pTyr-binding forkhead associated (FHA) protein
MAVGESITVGRAPTNIVVLNDATVSRNHIALSRGADGKWQIEVVSANKTAIVGDLKLAAGANAAISSGTRIQLGDVVLTFQTGADFVNRIRLAVGGPA